MSGDDHGHGHSSPDDGPSDIIPVGSFQDFVLGVVCFLVLLGFLFWGYGFVVLAKEHAADKPPAEAAEHSAAVEH